MTDEESSMSSNAQKMEEVERRKNKGNTDDWEDVFGIDLGTTNTCVAVVRRDGKPTPILINGENIIPSVVTFTKRTLHIGHEADEREDRKNPKQTVRFCKRIMGRSCAELSETEKKLISFDLATMKGNKAGVRVQFLEKERVLHPEFVSGMILSHIRHVQVKNYDVKGKLKMPKVVISVPAYFSQNSDMLLGMGKNCRT